MNHSSDLPLDTTTLPSEMVYASLLFILFCIILLSIMACRCNSEEQVAITRRHKPSKSQVKKLKLKKLLAEIAKEDQHQKQLQIDKAQREQVKRAKLRKFLAEIALEEQQERQHLIEQEQIAHAEKQKQEQEAQFKELLVAFLPDALSKIQSQSYGECEAI